MITSLRDRRPLSARTARTRVLAAENRPATWDTPAAGNLSPPSEASVHPSALDDAAGRTPEPDRAPHPVDDPAWRFVTGIDDPAPDASDVPFGLPVLAELPDLAAALADLREADRLVARALDTLLRLRRGPDVLAVTGVGLEAWISAIARRTRADGRMLLAAMDALERLPTLHDAFIGGRLSWAQVRSVSLKVRPLPRSLDDRIDGSIASALEGATREEPDAVPRAVGWALAAIDPVRTERRERLEEQQEYLAMQPRLDGSGGRLWGELGPRSWAVVDAALNDALDDGRHLGDTGTDGTAMRDSARQRPTTAVARAGRRRLAALVAVCDASLADTTGVASTGDAAHRGRGPGARPTLLLRMELDALLDRNQVPATLLTSLLGGGVHVSSRTARQLVEERGADLRAVVIDRSGSVVGVGRRRRLAPGWLAEAVLALHDTCAAPGCLEAARRCQLDHARPWHPTGPDQLPGRTDVDQLAPLCSRHNQRKERDGWIVEQHADGYRRWLHQRSGLEIETRPGTWHRGQAPTGADPP